MRRQPASMICRYLLFTFRYKYSKIREVRSSWTCIEYPSSTLVASWRSQRTRRSMPLYKILPHGELGKIIEEVRAAASEWGFFYVANHGLSEQEVGGFQTAMRAFFRLSKQIKRTIHRNTTNNRGYVEGELTKNKTDWKECFDFAGSGEDGPVTGKNDRLGEDRN
ncbi:non-hem dioxygenase in morphine synthesis N-terminal [Phytophthora infestans]|uniref:Non-hem dioxygenase in morphine synthesis N-terminal n=1 Tax=Phytophthora infestans TaxID=4787 RepID=A0A8S9VF24_PHYIN|nr:non-hem dioxygenase in morphine synthesis N-terminal [Phytophthora infestans]